MSLGRSMRAVLWIWPARSRRGSPACRPCWIWVLTSMQGINMVNYTVSLIQKSSFFSSFNHWKTNCFCLISKGKTPLLHALASSDGLTVHNTENIQLLLHRGTDSSSSLCLLVPSQAGSRLTHCIHTCVSMHTCPPVCTFRSK